MTFSHFVVLDVETSGPSLDRNFLVAIGAVLICVNTKQILAKFKRHLEAAPFTSWDPDTMSGFWLRPKVIPKYYEYIYAQKTTPTQAALDFYQFLVASDEIASSGGGKCCIAVDNTTLDGKWISMLLDRYLAIDVTKVFRHSDYQPIFNITDFYSGISGDPERKGALQRACESLNVSVPLFEGVAHDHDPLNDAEAIAKSFVEVLSVVHGRHSEKFASGTAIAPPSGVADGSPGSSSSSGFNPTPKPPLPSPKLPYRHISTPPKSSAA